MEHYSTGRMEHYSWKMLGKWSIIPGKMLCLLRKNAWKNGALFPENAWKNGSLFHRKMEHFSVGGRIDQCGKML